MLDGLHAHGGFQPLHARQARDLRAQQLVELKGVAEVFSVAGQYDLVAIVRVKENEELAEVVSEKMRKLQGVQLTETMIAFRVFTKAAVEGMFDLGS